MADSLTQALGFHSDGRGDATLLASLKDSGYDVSRSPGSEGLAPGDPQGVEGEVRAAMDARDTSGWFSWLSIFTSAGTLVGLIGVFPQLVWLSERVLRRPAAITWMNRASGTVLVALGLRLAATER